MRIASRFSIAVHVLSLLDADTGEVATSEWMAGSIGVNPVIVRNITGQLRRAGLVVAHQGVAGANLAKPLSEITLLDVFRAAEVDGELFSMHQNPNPACPIGATIQTTLEGVFLEAQQALEARLESTRMDEVVRQMKTQAAS